MISVIPGSVVVEINSLIVKSHSNVKMPVDGCLSSYFYYETPLLQISSIVHSLIKGHYFHDGNKRTAFAVFLILCEANNIPISYTEGEYAPIFEDIAANPYDVYQVSNLLFKEITNEP